MRLHPLIVVAWLSTSVVSCYARVVSAQTPVVPDSAQLAAIWRSIYYRTFDSVVVSAGLSRLRSSALPEGHREVRIWVGGGFTAPEDLYRFVDDRGHVSGELVRYWGVRPAESLDSSDHRPGEPSEDLVLYSLRGSCSRFSRDGSRYRAYHYNNPDARRPSPRPRAPWRSARRSARSTRSVGHPMW